jgi:hypothetical protein
MVSSGFLRSVALVRTDVSEEPGASFIRVTEIGELGTTQVATSNRRTLRRKTSVLTRATRRNNPEDTILLSQSDLAVSNNIHSSNLVVRFIRLHHT